MSCSFIKALIFSSASGILIILTLCIFLLLCNQPSLEFAASVSPDWLICPPSCYSFTASHRMLTTTVFYLLPSFSIRYSLVLLHLPKTISLPFDYRLPALGLWICLLICLPLFVDCCCLLIELYSVFTTAVLPPESVLQHWIHDPVLHLQFLKCVKVLWTFPHIQILLDDIKQHETVLEHMSSSVKPSQLCLLMDNKPHNCIITVILLWMNSFCSSFVQYCPCN